MTRLILIDRDGVINHDSVDYIKTPEEWVPIPGSLMAIAALQQAGYKVGVCSNQAGIGRGIIKPEALEAIHGKMAEALSEHGSQLDGLLFCPHHPAAGCGCRKPKPGMLLTMMSRLHARPDETWYVGDSVKDAEAAASAGCRFALVRTGNGRASEQTLKKRAKRTEHPPDQGQTKLLVYDDLLAFVSWLTRKEPCCSP